RTHDELGRSALERFALERLLVHELDTEQRAGHPLALLAEVLVRERAHQRRDLPARDVRWIALVDPSSLADQTPVLRIWLHGVVRHAVPAVPPPVVLRFELGPDRVRLLDEP